MISITRRYHFEAAHHLPHVPDGHKCKAMHGHNYQVEVTVTGKGQHGGVDDRGFVLDFAELDAIVEPLLKLLDHKVVNDQIANPTAEHIAFWIATGVSIADRVRVYETRDCWAEWNNAGNVALNPSRERPQPAQAGAALRQRSTDAASATNQGGRQ